MLVEGVRLCEEVWRAGLEIEEVLFTESVMRDERGQRLLEELRRAAARTQPVGASVLAFVSDTKTPQGIVALARRPDTMRQAFERALEPVAHPLLVVMHRANNPVNAGAMLRVAEAAGAAGAIATRGSTDLFSPKALRGSMGSSFRLPLWDQVDYEEALAWCNARGVRSVSADLHAPQSHTEIDWTVPCAVVVGPEADGLSAEESALTDLRVRIPMRPPVESLNVAVALAVVLYEANRQRGLD